MNQIRHRCLQKKKSYSKWAVIFIGMMCILTGCQTTSTSFNTVSQVHVSSEEVELEEENEIVEQAVDVVEGKEVSIVTSFGYEKYAKYGRYMCVKAQITNYGEDFVGEFQLVVPAREKNVLYQKDVSIASNETKTVTLDVPVTTTNAQYTIRLVDHKNKVQASKGISTNISVSSQYPYIGVLSDSIEELAYIRTANVKMFALDEKTLPDTYLGLDTLDLIVINDYDTSKLTQKQYTAIKNWVLRGGTLVLGTGVTSQKTLQMFQDDFIRGRIGRVEEDLLDISVEGALVLEYQDEKPIYQKVDKGLGNIQIFSKDLSVYHEDQDTLLGSKTITNMLDNLSQSKKTQLLQEQEGYYNRSYDIINALNVTEQSNTPEVSRYAVILCSYILIIGPILYLILKKIDKRNLTWIVIPVLSLGFSFIIYQLGTNTRINKPYIGYLSILELQDNNTNTALEQTYFSVTSPTNAKLHFSVKGDHKINLFDTSYNYYYDPNVNPNRKESLCIKDKEGETEIVVKDNPAFAASYFQTQSVSSIDGSYESNIMVKDYKVSGDFTNQLGYDLSAVAIYSDGILVPIGDLENGKTIDVTQKQAINLTTRDALYAGNIIDEIVGENMSSGNVLTQKRRQNFAIEYYLETNFETIQKRSFLIGCIDQKSNEMIDSIGYEANGVTAIIIPLNMSSYIGQEKAIYNINQYGNAIEGYYDKSYLYMDEVVIMEYNLPAEEQVSAILYSETMNQQWYASSDMYEESFIGTIEAYNYDTKEYDVIFSRNEYGRWKILKPYIQNGTTIRLRYAVDTTSETYYSDAMTTMPILSVVKGGD